MKDKSRKPSSKAQSTEIKELQTLTIADLEAITGAKGVVVGAIGTIPTNHNETVVGFSKLPQKPKLSSEDKPGKVTELQTLTIADLGVIAGAGIGTSPGLLLRATDGQIPTNHNETVVKFPNLSRKPKAFSEDKPAKVTERQALTIAELELITALE